MITNENLKDLVKDQNLLREASFSDNDLKKKWAIEQIHNSSPDIANEVSCEWDRRYLKEELISHHSAFELTSVGTDANVELYLWVINNRINQYYNWSVSSTAIHRIFFQPQPLSQDYVLYKEDKEELKVSDFMSVLSYGKKFTEAFFGVDSPKTSEYMLAVKTVDLAINHKEVDKPLNKTLHIINDVLTESAKERQKDESGKKAVSRFSLLIDLAIDFLIKG